MEPRLTSMKGQLGQVDVSSASASARSTPATAVAKAKKALAEIRQLGLAVRRPPRSHGRCPWCGGWGRRAASPWP